MTPGEIAQIAAAMVVCLLLLWNFILKKRMAKYRHFSSSQGERYRQFFDNCPDALLVVEHEGSIVSANAEATRLLKLDGQDLLAKTFWDFVTDGVSRAGFTKQFNLCVSGKKMHCEGDVRASDGTVIPVEVNGSLQRIDGKNLVQLYIRDISVLREVEEQVRCLYNQLDQVTVDLEEKEKLVNEESLLARKEFTALANHQIRTPLNDIMGMAQLLTDTTLSIEQRNCVYSIIDSSIGLLNVVRSISETSEGATEEFAPQVEFVNLRSMCETLSRKYEPVAVHKGIDFRCECQSNVPMNVVTDRRLLRQVLSTLVDNAIKYTEQGLVMLNIECRHESSDAAELHFQVIDTGLGIDTEFQSIIFENPDQTHDHTFARYYGGGLGLAVSRHAVEQLGGRIGLTSTKGKGSTFYFGLTLPLELPMPAADLADESKSFIDPPINNHVQASVLLVDDNKISQKVVAAMLRKVGSRVDAVGNGKEALTQIQRKYYDVILMDCQMPVMDGYEATASIRAMQEPLRSIPIIAMTAHSLKHELQACRDCGMDDQLVKPLDRKKLIETVDKYSQMRRVERAAVYQAAS